MEEKYIQGYEDMTDFEKEDIARNKLLSLEIISDYWFYEGAIQTGGLIEESMTKKQKYEYDFSHKWYDDACETLLGEQK